MPVGSALKIPYLTEAIIICHIKEMYRLNMERAFANVQAQEIVEVQKIV